MDRLTKENDWPCRPKDLRADADALHCFGKCEAEQAAAVVLTILQAANEWTPFAMAEFERLCQKDPFTLSGFDYLFQADRVYAVPEGYAVTTAFAREIFQHQRR